MDVAQSCSPQELVERARYSFLGPLIVSAASLVLFGYNLSQFLRYRSVFWSRDKVWIRVWVVVISTINGASIAYGGVYADYLVSVESWNSKSTAREFALQSAVSSILIGTVIFMVQFFWITCVYRMTEARAFRWLVILPVGVISLSSFLVSIALAAILTRQSTYTVLKIQSILLKVSSGLALGADILILTVIIVGLYRMNYKSRRLKKRSSRLTFTFCFVLFLSALVLVGEIVAVSPTGSQSRYVIDFTYLYTPVYTGAILAILNSRREQLSSNQTFLSEETTASLDESGPPQPQTDDGQVINLELSLENFFEREPRNVAKTI